MTRAERAAMIDRDRADLSVRRQCALLGLARPGVYRQPTTPDPEELALMRWIDEQYLATPFYCSRRMTAELRRAGLRVNRKRVQRLMRLMGARSAGPKAEDQPARGAAPDLSLPAARPDDRPTQPSVGRRHYTYIPIARGLLAAAVADRCGLEIGILLGCPTLLFSLAKIARTVRILSEEGPGHAHTEGQIGRKIIPLAQRFP